MRNKLSKKGFFRRFLKSESGSVLLEGLIALIILSLTAASVLLLTGMAIQGHLMSDTAYEEAFALNSIRDAAAEKIEESGDKSPAAIAAAVGSITASRKGWGFQILSEEDGLYTLLLIHEGETGTHEFPVKLYTGL